MMRDQPSFPEAAILDWWGGAPVSRRFGDPYFSQAGGLAEARHVFLAGNGLPGRAGAGFRVLELGFGAGLNLLATLLALRGAGMAGPVAYTAFEAHPMAPGDRVRALGAFPEVEDVAAELAALSGPGPWSLPPVTLEVIPGDARLTLPAWNGGADAVYLDGFSPARNPEMWEPALLAHVAARMAPGATLATYTAAGAVRRALAAAGLAVERAPGFSTKRHMTLARRPA